MNLVEYRPRWVAVSLSLLLLSGCGSKTDRRALHGRVQIDGEAIAQGSISFLPAKGSSGPAANTAVVDGEYGFTDETGPYSGPHRVLIDVDPQPRPDEAEEEGPAEDVKAIDVNAARAGAARSRPPRLRGEPTTKGSTKRHWELEYTVPEDGENRKDFDLSR